MRAELERRFRDQSRFADGYSPLYASLFATVSGWLAGGEPDAVVEWLLEVADGRPSFDVTLLLAAAIHRQVLAGNAPILAGYYPTAPAAQTGQRAIGVTFPLALRETILTHRESLAEFIRTANVQTNETGRGLAWLLPVACLGWPAAHLVELGASAGLNLVADRRTYRLVDAAEPSRTLLTLGNGPAQFTTLAGGAAEIPPLACCPDILSRTGGDVHPYNLSGPEHELTLASFVWGDQVARLERLREGIAALRAVESSAAPIRLRPLRLPDDLPAFLAALPRRTDAPVVMYNTTVTMYLPDHGESLRDIIAGWATTQPVPVLWLQWEPWWGGPEPPERDWFSWSADFWPNDGLTAHRLYRLGWVHPHGIALNWLPDWSEFLCISMQS